MKKVLQLIIAESVNKRMKGGLSNCLRVTRWWYPDFLVLPGGNEFQLHRSLQVSVVLDSLTSRNCVTFGPNVHRLHDSCETHWPELKRVNRDSMFYCKMFSSPGKSPHECLGTGYKMLKCRLHGILEFCSNFEMC